MKKLIVIVLLVGVVLYIAHIGKKKREGAAPATVAGLGGDYNNDGRVDSLDEAMG